MIRVEKLKEPHRVRVSMPRALSLRASYDLTPKMARDLARELRKAATGATRQRKPKAVDEHQSA